MEHPDDAPLADDGQRGAVPNDQPAGGAAGPEDEKAPQRPRHSGDDGDDDDG
jgi:hypothetical protein